MALFGRIQGSRFTVARKIHQGTESILDGVVDLTTAQAKESFAYANEQQNNINQILQTFRLGGGPAVPWYINPASKFIPGDRSSHEKKRQTVG